MHLESNIFVPTFNNSQVLPKNIPCTSPNQYPRKIKASEILSTRKTSTDVCTRQSRFLTKPRIYPASVRSSTTEGLWEGPDEAKGRAREMQMTQKVEESGVSRARSWRRRITAVARPLGHSLRTYIYIGRAGTCIAGSSPSACSDSPDTRMERSGRAHTFGSSCTPKVRASKGAAHKPLHTRLQAAADFPSSTSCSLHTPPRRGELFSAPPGPRERENSDNRCLRFPLRGIADEGGKTRCLFGYRESEKPGERSVWWVCKEPAIMTLVCRSSTTWAEKV